MARKAYISSDMAHDERLFDIAEEHPIAVLMFPWIIAYLDDWGRGLASSKRIKSQLFPNVPIVTVDVIEEAIQVYADVGLLELYEDETHRYMAIPMAKWFSWQTHIRGEKRHKDNSKYPRCPTDCAQMREDACESAQVIEKRTPTPSLSLSLSLSKEGVVKPNIFEIYQQMFVTPMNSVQMEDLIHYMDKPMEIDLLIHDFKIAKRNNKGFGYALGIIKNQCEQGITTLAQLELFESQNQTAAGGDSNAARSEYRREIHVVSPRARSVTGGKVGKV